jgi:hypothetical protein
MTKYFVSKYAKCMLICNNESPAIRVRPAACSVRGLAVFSNVGLPQFSSLLQIYIIFSHGRGFDRSFSLCTCVVGILAGIVSWRHGVSCKVYPVAVGRGIVLSGQLFRLV